MAKPYLHRGAAPNWAYRAEFDEGLRRYMLRVFNYMALGLALTGVVAYLVGTTPALYEPIFGTPLKWVVMLAPLAFVFFFSFPESAGRALTDRDRGSRSEEPIRSLAAAHLEGQSKWRLQECS